MTLSLALAGPCAPLLAQAPCNLTWQPGEGIPGIDGLVNAMAVWDPDGAGPVPEQLVAVGAFAVAGDQRVDNVAVYDPVAQRWSALGSGFPSMRGTAVLVRSGAAAGQLVAIAGGRVWTWSGAAWQQLGSLTQVQRLVELANGDLVASGSFGLVGAMANCGLVRWDGVQWLPLGDPLTSWGLGSVLGMGALPNGDLVVGGLFSQIGGVACNSCARWDGTAWHALGAAPGPLTALFTTAAGEILARGAFGAGVGLYARWNGTAWVALPAGMPANAIPLAAHGANGVLFAAAGGLWVQDPSGWSQVASWSNSGSVGCAAFAGNGDVFVGGSFTTFESNPAFRVAHRRGGIWTSAGPGAYGGIADVYAAADGGFFVSGAFTIGGVTTNGLAHFDGSTWSPLPMPGPILDLVEVDDGSMLIAGGTTLLQWKNGVATWPQLPLGWGAQRLAPATGGAWVASVNSGGLLVLRWDHGTVQTIPILANGLLSDLIELPNGDLVLAGQFYWPVTTSLLRWDGQQMTAVPGAPAGINCLRLAGNGDLLVGGTLSAPFAGIARWDGVTWSALGALPTNRVLSIDVVPNGDVVVAERVSDVPSITRIQRWDGGQWTLLGEAKGLARTAWSTSGTLAVFGDFARVDGTVGAVFARLTSSCPAGAQDLGGGCQGGAGALLTRIEQRAWLGAEARTTTHSVMPNALAIGVFGASAVQLPLAQLLPIGGAGCTLRAQPDVLMALPVVGGQAVAQWTLPNAAAVLGASFVQQTVVLETSAGAPFALVAAGALQWTVGAW